MKSKWHTLKSAIALVLLLAMILSGCGSSEPAKPLLTTGSGGIAEPAEPESIFNPGGSDTPSGSVRDATPQISTPTAPGDAVSEANDSIIDYSNISDGYVMAQFTGDSGKIKLMIQSLTHTVQNAESVKYIYDIYLEDEIRAFPISLGDGEYTISILKQLPDGQYTALNAVNIDVEMTDNYSRFLYPNALVRFDENSDSTLKAQELATGATSELGAIENIFNFIVDNVSYDWDLAATPNREFYVPDADKTLADGTGTCYEYSVLMTSMLRSQGIPTQMVFGDAGGAYHAWLNVHSKETGTVDTVIHFDGSEWTLMDPTFASSGNRGAEYQQYIGDGANYTAQYFY